MKEASRRLGTGFILSIGTACGKASGNPEAWLEMHTSLKNHAAVMMTLPPSVLLIENDFQKDGEVLFVVDRSGSMDGKMGNVKSAMRFLEESLQKALDFVDKQLRADIGGEGLNSSPLLRQ